MTGGETRCALAERNCVYFNLIFASNERNQTQFELSSKFCDVIEGCVSPSVHSWHAKKHLIYI